MKINPVKKNPALNVLRATAVLVVITGALSSLSFMFNTGRNQSSILLIMLFTIWVLSPFAGFLLIGKLSKQWQSSYRVILFILMILVTIISLIFYSGLIKISGTRPAFVFLVVPFVSLLILVITFLLGRSSARRNANI